MSAFSAIDLEKLPPPEVVEILDFEDVLSEMLADLQSRWPEFTAALESEPAVKILEVAAYREVQLRARINDASRAVMLAFAQKNDLEHIAAPFGVERQEVSSGDPDALPPILPTFENDDRLRQRTQLSLEGHTTAGTIGSYKFHALAADARIKDVDVQSPTPGDVVVTLLSTENSGNPSAEVLTNVRTFLNAEDVRPLTDRVTVNASEVISYDIEAELILFDGPDEEVVRRSSENALRAYVADRHRLGHDIALSGLYASLHQPGIQRVVLVRPTADLVIQPHQAPWNTGITITLGGRGE
ncbi:MAG: baseplate J/gp47 family protein [Agarilytica sp.]